METELRFVEKDTPVNIHPDGLNTKLKNIAN